MGSHNPNLSNDIYLITHLDPYCITTWRHTCFNETWWARENKIIYPILNTIEGVAKLINIQT